MYSQFSCNNTPNQSEILPNHILQSSIEQTTIKQEQKHIENENYQELQIQLLIEECEELISKLQMNQSCFEDKEQDVPIGERERLEKEFMDLCIEIQRQEKQLQNYKFKIQVANKEAQYYTRQIKEKQQILHDLQNFRKKKKK